MHRAGTQMFDKLGVAENCPFRHSVNPLIAANLPDMSSDIPGTAAIAVKPPQHRKFCKKSRARLSDTSSHQAPSAYKNLSLVKVKTENNNIRKNNAMKFQQILSNSPR